jgi:intron-binding protein aquarius
MSAESDCPLVLRLPQLLFITTAFRSLDNALIRKECAPLVSISIWHYLHSDEARAAKFEQHQLRKAWKAANKRYENAEAETEKPWMDLQRSWLHSMIKDFIRRIQFNEGNDYGKKILVLDFAN